MTQPVPFTRSADYSDDAAASAGGRSTISPTKLDAEFDAVVTTLGQVLTNLALIQRDDTELNDGTVKIHTLSTDVRALLAASGVTVRGAWVTATSYGLKDIVTQAGATYICAIAHTAGVFATDLGFGRWLLLANSPSAFAATSISVTPAGGIAASNAQAALEELDTEKMAKAANLSDVADPAAARANLSVLALGGGTLTGPLVLPGAPTLALQAATKGYADGVVMGLDAGQCYFDYLSATQCVLLPYKGNKIFIAGAWLTIPTNGVTLSNSGALLGGGTPAANTTYNVYAFNNGGAVSLIMGTQARTTDPAYGHQVAAGFPTHTLVGKVRLNSSAQFNFTPAFMGVISYFNRRQRQWRGALSQNRSFSFNSVGEVNPEARLTVLAWGEDQAIVGMHMMAFANGAHIAYGGPGANTTSATLSTAWVTTAQADHWGAFSTSNRLVLGDGGHTIYMLGYAGSGLVTFSPNGAITCELPA